MRVTDHLLFYPWESLSENNCNSYIVNGSRKVLIDPGHLHLLSRLEDAMVHDGIAAEDIDLVVVTHPHPDHGEGAARWTRSTTMVSMHRDAKAFCEEFSHLWQEMTGKTPPVVSVDFFLREGRFRVGPHHFQVIETPGHAPGSICLLFEEEKILFSGDVIFARSFGRFDLPGGNPLQLLQSIEHLMTLDVEVLAPGHGPLVRGKGAVRENFYMVLTLFREMLATENVRV